MGGKDDLAHPLASLATCVRGSWTMCQGFLDYAQCSHTEILSCISSKVVIFSTTACEKVNFKRQVYDFSETEKNLSEKM